jgi:hypothetical protein
MQGIKLYWHVLETMLKAEEARAGLPAAGTYTMALQALPSSLWGVQPNPDDVTVIVRVVATWADSDRSTLLCLLCLCVVAATG